jgi:hypothetical protein
LHPKEIYWKGENCFPSFSLTTYYISAIFVIQ